MPPKSGPSALAGKSTQSSRRVVQPPNLPQLRPIVAFSLFLAVNTLAALFSTIQDCDEVFNYWEPTHYLNYRHGLQTWEYSPEYAIRSWAYTGIHATVIQLGHLLPFVSSKVAGFYFLRIVLGLVCAVCETRLFSAISRTLNPRIAIFFLIVMVFSSGTFHASTAYLPSSFAMYTTMLGFSAFMDWQGGIKTAQGIMWFALGSLLGWPFAGALVLPFIAEEILLAFTSGALFAGFLRLLNGIVRSLFILFIQVAIDTFFYKKLVNVPLNIVLYNVFSGGSKGPNIYGVEPWHFYIRNLSLNFNIWFWLALTAFPLLLLQHILLGKAIYRQSLLRGIVFVTPFYLWLGIFTLQPHKEERFMYPAYPALALNAAIAFHILLANFGSTEPGALFSKISPKVKLLAVGLSLLASTDLSVFRTIGLITAYSAPLKVYKPLQNEGVVRPGDNVCLGKEWYRFPSSYFLPEGSRAKFIKSEFSGLLPGEFHEASVDFGLYPGAWLTPRGMNDENKEDPGKHTPIDNCDFLIDLALSSAQPTALEPNYVFDNEHWEQLACEPFMDVGRTSVFGRLLWIPDWPEIPQRYRRALGKYCLLRRKERIHRVKASHPHSHHH